MTSVLNPDAITLDIVSPPGTIDPDAVTLDLGVAGSVFPEYQITGQVKIRGVVAARAISILSLPPAGIEEVANGSSDALGDYDILYRIDDRWQAFAMAIDDYGVEWQTLMVLSQGDLIHPPTPNGFVYHADSAGTLPISEPAWWFDYTGEAAAQVIGTATLKAVQYLSPQLIGPLLPEPT